MNHDCTKEIAAAVREARKAALRSALVIVMTAPDLETAADRIVELAMSTVDIRALATSPEKDDG